jgi:hypothetical protein
MRVCPLGMVKVHASVHWAWFRPFGFGQRPTRAWGGTRSEPHVANQGQHVNVWKAYVSAPAFKSLSLDCTALKGRILSR